MSHQSHATCGLKAAIVRTIQSFPSGRHRASKHSGDTTLAEPQNNTHSPNEGLCNARKIISSPQLLVGLFVLRDFQCGQARYASCRQWSEPRCGLFGGIIGVDGPSRGRNLRAYRSAAPPLSAPYHLRTKPTPPLSSTCLHHPPAFCVAARHPSHSRPNSCRSLFRRPFCTGLLTHRLLS